MFAYLKGIVEDITEENVVIDVHDVGYNVKVSAYTAGKIAGIGEIAKLYTYTSVKEDAFQLYGFLTKDELELFKLCITVSGIGPKGAQAILSVLDPNSLRYAIIAGDVKAISNAPGIGKRTAERLILELKSKVTLEAPDSGDDNITVSRDAVPDSQQKKEAVEALVALGYGQTESLKAVNSIPGIETMESGTILKAALKKMFI